MRRLSTLCSTLCAICAEIAAMGGPPSPATAPFPPDAARGDTRPPAPGRVVLDAPGHVCVEGMGTVARGGEPGVAWALLDWRGRETGHSGVFDAEGASVIPPLPTGYYQMVRSNCPAIRNAHQSSLSTTLDGNPVLLATLAVVPPPESRVRDPASFYAADYGPIYEIWKGERGWLCPWNGGDRYRTLADLAWLVGVPHVRNRIEWCNIEPKPGVFSPEGSCHWREAELLGERGIAGCGVFAGAPHWARPRERMPTDLDVVWRFCARLAADFGDRMDGWEFWNEPDIGFAPGPVWDYAAAMKAAYLGFKAGRLEAVALPASHCRSPGNVYMRTLYANDAFKFADAFNYHLGQPISDIQSRLGTLRQFLDKNGMEGRAIWMTENECEMEGHATGKGVMEGHKAHSPEQELIVAEFYPKSQIAQQMAGVSRCYFFILGAYDERGGEKDWGMMRRDGAVKPVYAAMSTMTRELVSARLAGELDVGSGAKAFLFNQPDGSQTVAFWAVSPIDTANADKPVAGEMPDFARDVVLHMATASPVAAYSLSDLCGSISQIAATNGVLTLPATRFPAYVSGLRGLIADIPARPRGETRSYAPAPDEDLTVIVRAELDKDDFAITRNKTRAVLKKDGGRVKVFIWNLGDGPKTGTVEVAGGRIAGLPQEPFTLGPRGSKPVIFECTFAPDEGVFDCDFVLSGRFNGRRGSRTCIPVWHESRFFAGCVETPLAWDRPEAWTRNDSAQHWKCSWDEEEKAMRFDFEWTESVGHWAYPYYHLAPDESLVGARMLAFDVKTAQDKMENDHNYANVYLSGDTLPYEPPNGNWERRGVELPAEGLEEERAIRIGVAPRGRKLTLWIRNISVLK